MSELKNQKIYVVVQRFIMILLYMLVETWTETSSRHCVYNRISGPVSSCSSGRVGGGDPPLQACRDPAGTSRTRVVLSRQSIKLVARAASSQKCQVLIFACPPTRKSQALLGQGWRAGRVRSLVNSRPTSKYALSQQENIAHEVDGRRNLW